MQIFNAFRLVFKFLMYFSITMLLPLVVVFSLHEQDGACFFLSALITFTVGAVGYYCLRNCQQPLNQFGGFVVVALFWIIFSCFSALPFFLSPHCSLDFTASLFETVSGFTTTSASTITHLDILPKALLYYRQQLEFFGGLGMITLAIALMPHLNIGAAKKLYLSETPDPEIDQAVGNLPDLTLTHNVRKMWLFYLATAVVCATAYWLAGMNLLDAVNMSFTSVSTGGFVPHDANFNYYPQASIVIIAEIFMIIAALNFNIHLQAIQQRSLRPYWKDTETKIYLLLIIFITAITFLMLNAHHLYANKAHQLKDASFNVISFMTTTGYFVGNYTNWPGFIPYLFMIVALIGTPGNSTGGGLKILRFWVILKCIYFELQYLVDPTVKKPMYVSGQHINEIIIRGVLVFFAVYAAWIVCVIFWLIELGLDLTSAFGVVAACLTNVGLGIGKYAYIYRGIGHPAEWLLMITMIAGRLEIFTILVLFMPSLWRKN